ncbi:MAG TPA: hypothetical protein DDW81_01455 [Cryomorphaceae bacterium]|nr:hypothetical protein [Owenweeksia sp.]HBF18729.1 hypothetical protein [Cryomorphaceae bacterium]HCQ16855.1 hypothetical protein [Cryomorphaceae bacterium]
MFTPFLKLAGKPVYHSGKTRYARFAVFLNFTAVKKHIMRTFPFVILMILMVSCDAPKNPVGQTWEQTQSRKKKPQADTDCVYFDSEVYSETVGIWENSWYYLLGTCSKELNDQRRKEIGGRSFTSKKVEKLLNQCEDCDAVRVYFALPAEMVEPVIPELLLVNMKQCKDVLGEKLPVLSSEGGVFMSVAAAKGMCCSWANRFGGSPDSVFVPIYGYTFKREIVEDLLVSNTLRFSFAVHSVSIGNVVYGTPVDANINGHMALDLVLNAEDDPADRTYMDFAMPCPQLCDNDSELMTCALENL